MEVSLVCLVSRVVFSIESNGLELVSGSLCFLKQLKLQATSRTGKFIARQCVLVLETAFYLEII